MKLTLIFALFGGMIVNHVHFDTVKLGPQECQVKTAPTPHVNHEKDNRTVFTTLKGGIPLNTSFIVSLNNSKREDVYDTVQFSECNFTENEITVPEVDLNWIVVKEKKNGF